MCALGGSSHEKCRAEKKIRIVPGKPWGISKFWLPIPREKFHKIGNILTKLWKFCHIFTFWHSLAEWCNAINLNYFYHFVLVKREEKEYPPLFESNVTGTQFWADRSYIWHWYLGSWASGPIWAQISPVKLMAGQPSNYDSVPVRLPLGHYNYLRCSAQNTNNPCCP